MILAEFTLGTAQLGLEYGIANRTGKPAREDAIAIVQAAINAGVRSIDTARAYGDAESRIGEALASSAASGVRVVTKLGRLEELDPGAGEQAVRNAVDASVTRSMEELRLEKIETLLLHDWAHHTAFDGAVWRGLLEHRASGRISGLGGSVYEPEEAAAALADPTVSHIQIPLNVLDWRWRAAGVDGLARERPDVTIHARSALLQGLLAADSDVWQRVQGADLRPYLDKLDRLAAEFGRRSRADLCLAYVRSQPWVSSVVVGVETRGQLDENVGLFRQPRLSADECARIEQEVTGATEDLLNPSRWKVTRR